MINPPSVEDAGKIKKVGTEACKLLAGNVKENLSKNLDKDHIKY